MVDKKMGPNSIQKGLIKTIGVDKYLRIHELNKNADKVYSLGDENTELKLREFKMWYDAEPRKIEHFYKTNFHQFLYPQNEFWRVVNTSAPKVHYPLASTISNAFGTLLFSDRPKFSVDAGSITKNKKYTERLAEIADMNDILSLLQEGAKLQSYSGAVALKLNVDKTLADTPLITSYPKERFEVHKKYNQVVYIDFLDYTDEYIIISRYGRGYIEYIITDLSRKRLNNPELKAALGYEDVAFADNEGSLIPIIFAEVIPNKADSKSDYEGLVPMFHALDEIYSALVNYVRKTKPNIFVTEDLIRKGSDGRPLPLNEFDNVITVLDSVPGNEQSKIEREAIKLEIQGFRDALESTREMILTKINLSPATLGLPSGGARESSMALNIRERASFRARSEKLAIWEEKLNNFLFSALVLDQIMSSNIITENNVFIVDKIDALEIKSDFGEHTKPTLEEKIKYFSEAIKSKMVSIEFAIAQTFGDRLSDTELMFLIIQTKQQNGISLSEEEIELLAKDKELKRNKFTVLKFTDK